MAKALSYFLLALIPLLMTESYNVIVDILNHLINVLVPFATHVVQLFPPNPCGSLIGSCTDTLSVLPTPEPTLLEKGLSTLAWILPVQYLTNLIGCVMLTVLIYFTMAPIARWLKLLN